MNLLPLLKNILTEATIDDIYQKYYSRINREEFNQIIKADPQTTGNKMGRYAKVLLKLYKKGGMFLEDVPKALQYLNYVYKHKVSLVDNEINSLNDIYEKIKIYMLQDKKDFYQAKSELDKNEYEHVFAGKRWDIYVPLTERAACYLGVNTEWCTTWGENSLNTDYKNRTNHYSSYTTKERPLYIIVDRKDANNKFQFHFGTGQYMNPADRQINIKEFFANHEEVLFYFFPMLTKENPSESELRLALQSNKILPKKYSDFIIETLLKDIDSNLITAIREKDVDSLKKYFIDNRIVEIDFNTYSELTIETKDSLGELSDIPSYIKNNDNLVEYYFDGSDAPFAEFIRMMRVFNEKEEKFIKEKFGSVSRFEQTFKDIFDENDLMGYQYKFFTAFDEAFQEKFRDSAWSVLNDIETKFYNEHTNIIESHSGGYYSNSEFTFVNIPILELFIIEKDIAIVNDVEDFIESFLYYNDLCTSVDCVYEAISDKFYGQAPYPSYEEMLPWFKEYLEEFAEDIPYDEIKLEKQLTDIIQKWKFEKLWRKRYNFENDTILLTINMDKINYDERKVMIVYKNKKTNESYSGWVKVENLPKYLSIYPLALK